MNCFFVGTTAVLILVHTELQAWVESLDNATAYMGDTTAWKSAAAEGLGQSPGCFGRFIWRNQEGGCLS